MEEQVAVAPAHSMFMAVEALAIIAIIGTVCYFVIKTARDPTVPVSIKNRLLFGVMVFALAVFVINKFGTRLSNDTMIFVLGIIFGSGIGVIIAFYFDMNKDADGNGEPSGNAQTGATPTHGRKA